MNVYLYFSYALSSESVRTGETYSTENPSQNYECCSQDCSTILSSDEYILQQVLFAQLWPLFLSFTLCSGKQDWHYSYQKYASDNIGPPSKKKKGNASGCVWECKIFLWRYNFKLSCLWESPLTEWRALWKALQLGQQTKYLMEHIWKKIGQR